MTWALHTHRAAGTPAMTTRGATEEHFEQIADFVHRGVQIAQGRKAEMEAAGTKKLAAFKQSLAENPPSECEALRQEVRRAWCAATASMALATIG